MDNENYSRLNELAFAREHRRVRPFEVLPSTMYSEAKSNLWIMASVLLTDEQAERMIKTLEESIVLDAIYYSNKVEK